MRLHNGTLANGRADAGGMWLRALCSDCNSLAGGLYDPAYADFAHEVFTRIKPGQRLALPPVRVAPGRVARSILIGMFATSPHLRAMFPELADGLSSPRSALRMPDGASLRLALHLTSYTRLSGMYNAVNWDIPNGYYDTFSEVYFRPFAWTLTPNDRVGARVGPSVPEQQGWAVVDGWLRYGDDVTAMDLRRLCPSLLPVTRHPLRTGEGRENWIEYVSDRTTTLLEGLIPSGHGVPRAQIRRSFTTLG